MDCQVYNGAVVVNNVTPRKGLGYLLKGKAVLLQSYPGRMMRSGAEEYPMPSAVVLTPYNPKAGRHTAKPPQLKQHLLFARDEYTCQYCGRHAAEFNPWETLTREHVIPKSRGAKINVNGTELPVDSWQNVVAACSTCNRKKANRTPEEAGMTLLAVPYVPSKSDLASKKNSRRRPAA